MSTTPDPRADTATTPVRRAQCGTCRYAEPAIAGDTPVLECRRYPPQLFVAPLDDDPDAVDPVAVDPVAVDPVAVWSWPHMSSDDWCGEYTPPPGPPQPLRRPI